MIRSLLVSLALFGAFFEGTSAGKLEEWVGLRLGETSKHKDGVIALCADPKNHLLANLDKDGNVLQKWVPIKGENFYAILDLEAGTFKLSGRVVPKENYYSFKDALTIEFTYSNPVSYDQCYCADAAFLGYKGGEFKKYKKIQEHCNIKNYLSRPTAAAHKYFCPHCEGNKCQMAAKNRLVDGTPKPIYQDWIFFTEVQGSLSGPGLELFRHFIEVGFEEFGIIENIDACTPDITDQALPQLHCSDSEDPETGYGHGVNGKNQRCGFSSPFNCAEDVPQLVNDQAIVEVNVADINLDLISCPLNVSPTKCSKKPCKEVKVCVPCKYFPLDERCGDEGAWWFGDWDDDKEGAWWKTKYPKKPCKEIKVCVPCKYFPHDEYCGDEREWWIGHWEDDKEGAWWKKKCPQKPCKEIKVCVPCKYFPHDEHCRDEGAWWNGDWEDDNEVARWEKKFPKKPCKEVKVCVPCRYFPHDEYCGDEGAWWIGDWEDDNEVEWWKKKCPKEPCKEVKVCVPCKYFPHYEHCGDEGAWWIENSDDDNE